MAEFERYEEAKTLLQQVIDADIDTATAYGILLGISLIEENHADTLAHLKVLREEFEIDFGDLSLDPDFASFIGSSQHQEWLESLGE